MNPESIGDRLRDSRMSYERATLDEKSVRRDPHEQFTLWLDEALETQGIVEPNAMALSTVGPQGRPSSRIVLLRGHDARGFVFFTNYESEKGRELRAYPACAIVFFWGALERQIRIEGTADLLDAAESDAYFAKRPRGHRVSAWASPQSSVVSDRAFLEARIEEEERRFADREVERPPFWGGFRVVPDRFEFWQGRRNRVHDRIVYRGAAPGWTIERLAP